jgi:hypothetical protein
MRVCGSSPSHTGFPPMPSSTRPVPCIFVNSDIAARNSASAGLQPAAAEAGLRGVAVAGIREDGDGVGDRAAPAPRRIARLMSLLSLRQIQSRPWVEHMTYTHGIRIHQGGGDHRKAFMATHLRSRTSRAGNRVGRGSISVKPFPARYSSVRTGMRTKDAQDDRRLWSSCRTVSVSARPARPPMVLSWL